MKRILDITAKDLLQLMRERQTFLFLLIMPIAFTLLFAYALGGMGKTKSDPRLTVSYLDLDQGQFSPALEQLFATSSVVRLQVEPGQTLPDLEKLVERKKLAAAVLVPAGYSAALRNGAPLPLTVIALPTSSSTASIESEVLTITYRLSSAVRAARLGSEALQTGEAGFQATLQAALAAWQNPPVTVQVSSAAASKGSQATGGMSPAQTSPGMMLQFAIAGLLTAAQVIVNERKSRTLQRLLTTATSRVHILLGHYLAIFTLIFTQFVLLILFGQLVLKLDYLAQPIATLLIALTAALCIAALGLLIGALAKSDEQAVIFSLIPMFVFAGLGGAWVPLDVTGKAFRAIGHLSPVAWGMDGFKNILVNGAGLEAAWLPALALAGYGLLFFVLAAWRLQSE